MRDAPSSDAMRRMLAAEPVLFGVVRAGDALGLARFELLHAGPPLRDSRQPPPVLMSSAVMACLYEGWASDAAEAEAMIDSGKVTLSPAQDSGCVTPLAFVVSPSTPMFEVRDGAAHRAESAGAAGMTGAFVAASSPGAARTVTAEEQLVSDGGGPRSIYAPVSTVRGADLRMGFRDPAMLARLADRDDRVAPLWQRVLEAFGPVALLPLASRALAAGDDLHSRTTAATAELAAWLRSDLALHGLASDLDATPLFFLTIWMAASAAMLRAAEGSDMPSLVTRAGGNGERFGIALAGSPSLWVCVDASAPQGRRAAAAAPDAMAANACGDSAIIDMLGCGGQALDEAEEPRGVLGGFLPEDHAGLARRLMCAVHPLLGRPIGLDARRVLDEQSAPLIVLAMQAADGLGGFIGRGVYRPPVALFEQAVLGLARNGDARQPAGIDAHVDGGAGLRHGGAPS